MNKKAVLVLYSLLILVSSYFLIFRNYEKTNMFFDEIYYVTAAERYINDAIFFQAHPPLGKLAIALGEHILTPNKGLNKEVLLLPEYMGEPPVGMSMLGFRFFPVLFGTLCPLLFFLILFTISRKTSIAFLFTLFFLFNNDIIVHFRGAMLDSTMMFFVLLSTWIFVNIWHTKNASLWKYCALGLSMGLAVSTKFNSALILFFVPILLLKEKLTHQKVIRNNTLSKTLISLFCFFVVCFIIWDIHVMLGKRVLHDQDLDAPDLIKDILSTGNAQAPRYRMIMIANNFLYSGLSVTLIPPLDRYNPKEIGSYPTDWIVGAGGISYRAIVSDNSIKALYLQINPVTYCISLVAIVLSLSLVISALVFGLRIHDKNLFLLIIIFLSLYIIYMTTLIMLPRVLYQFHYFMPFTFSMILAYLVFLYTFREGIDKKAYISLILLVISTVLVFIYYSPLTYFTPLTIEEFYHRAWFSFWRLKSGI